jgi:hypothetical protein
MREVGRVEHGSELGQRNRGRQWRSPPLSLQDSHRTERGAPPPPQVYGAARVRSGIPGQERRLRRPDKTPACEIVELRNVARSLGRSTAQNSVRRRSPLAVAPHSTLIIRRMMLDKPGVSRDAGALDFPPKNFVASVYPAAPLHVKFFSYFWRNLTLPVTCDTVYLGLQA